MEDESPIVNAANQLPPKWGQGAPLPEPGPRVTSHPADSRPPRACAICGSINTLRSENGVTWCEACSPFGRQAAWELAQSERQRLIDRIIAGTKAETTEQIPPATAVVAPCPPLRLRRAFEV